MKKLGELPMLRNASTRSKINVSTKRSSKPLKRGDLARVRSLEEIQATLDKDGRYQGGMLFVDEMAKYCGGTYRVFKRVNKVFDALAWKMKKSQELIILNGVFCNGYDAYKECDRMCFFFWKEAWLEKIE